MQLCAGGTLPCTALTQYIHTERVSHCTFVLYHGCMLIIILGMVRSSHFLPNFPMVLTFEAMFMSTSHEMAA